MQAQRIIILQLYLAAAVALLAPPVWLGLTEAAGQQPWAALWLSWGGSLLLGSLAVIGPNWLYARLSREEHSPERLLLLAWVKVVGTLLLMAAAMALTHQLGWMPAWTLIGVVVAYVGHIWAAYRTPRAV